MPELIPAAPLSPEWHAARRAEHGREWVPGVGWVHEFGRLW